MLQDAHNRVIVGVLGNIDAFTDWVFVGKQPLCHAGCKDTAGSFAKALRIGNEMARLDDQTCYFSILWCAAHQATIYHVIFMSECSADFANWNGAFDGGNSHLQHVELVASQSIGSHTLRIQLFTGWFYGTNHNRVGTQALDLALRLAADAFANGKQPNHAGDTDKDTQHGQQRSQGVKPKTFDP